MNDYNSYEEEKKAKKENNYKILIENNKPNKYKYNHYEEHDKDKYKHINDNLNIEKKLEANKKYYNLQIILITIIYIILYITTIEGSIFMILGLFLIHGIIFLMIISFVTFKYCYKNINENKWFWVPLILSFIYSITMLVMLFFVFAEFASIVS